MNSENESPDSAEAKRSSQRANKVVPGRIDVKVSLPFDSQLRKVEGSKELILLLHGYQQSGAKIYRDTLEALPKTATVLAPNGPFPIPRKSDDGKIKLGYSWYFFDFAAKEFIIPMNSGIEFLVRGIHDLGFSDYIKTVIGFSQGGYMAPFLVNELSNVKQFIGIGCEFLHANYKPAADYATKAFRVDGIGGDNDEIVRHGSSRASHEKFLKLGFEGRFHSLPNVGHEINADVRNKLREILI